MNKTNYTLTRRITAFMCSILLAFGIVTYFVHEDHDHIHEAHAASTVYSFDFTDFAVAGITSTVTTGDSGFFTIVPGGSTAVTAQNRSGFDVSFSKRFTFGGKGDKTSRVIQFTTTSHGSMVAYWEGNADRKIMLDSDKNGVIYTAISTANSTLHKSEWVLPEADTYYIYPDNGFYFYGATVTVVTDDGDHNWGDVWTTKTPATCTEPGVDIQYCLDHNTEEAEIEGEFRTRAIPALGHDFVTTGETPATCTTPGSINQTCSVCGATNEIAIPAPGHQFVGDIASEEIFCAEGDSKIIQDIDRSKTKILNISNITGFSASTGMTANDFTISTQWNGGSGAGITEHLIDGNPIPGPEGISFTKRLQSNGASSTTNIRTISFSTEGPAIVKYWAVVASNDDASRKVAIRGGTEVNAGTEYNVQTAFLNTSAGAGKFFAVVLPAAGDYHIEIVGNGINFYYIRVDEGFGGIYNAEECVTGSHTFGEWVNIAPTCTEAGNRFRVCTACGFKEIENDSGYAAANPAAGHTWGSWNIEENATCTTAGSRYHVCTVCSHEQTEVIPATGHTWGNWTTVPATCTAAGSKTRECTACHDHETDAAYATANPAIAHTWGNWITVTEAKCTTAGSKKHVCSVCSAEATEAIPATGVHTWGDWATTKEPSKSEEGAKERVCSDCGDKETEAIAKLKGCGSSILGNGVILPSACFAILIAALFVTGRKRLPSKD